MPKISERGPTSYVPPLGTSGTVGGDVGTTVPGSIKLMSLGSPPPPPPEPPPPPPPPPPPIPPTTRSVFVAGLPVTTIGPVTRSVSLTLGGGGGGGAAGGGGSVKYVSRPVTTISSFSFSVLSWVSVRVSSPVSRLPAPPPLVVKLTSFSPVPLTIMGFAAPPIPAGIGTLGREPKLRPSSAFGTKSALMSNSGAGDRGLNKPAVSRPRFMPVALLMSPPMP